MQDDVARRAEEARSRAYAVPLAAYHVGDPQLFRSDMLWPWFERLRLEDPVHYCAASEFGPYWSVTKQRDIIAVDSNHRVFSSDAELGGFTIYGSGSPRGQASFVELDPPLHEQQRNVIAPMFSSQNLAALEPQLRAHTANVLAALPVGAPFDFVDRVAVELTSHMMALLFDFPFEQRRLLPRCSELMVAQPGPGSIVASEKERVAELFKILGLFIQLWDERKALPPANNLISLLALGEATRRDAPEDYLGNIMLLIAAGSDTARHAIAGGMLALDQNRKEYERLKSDPALIDSMVPEIIRWQSPIAHMRRTAREDCKLGGKTIRKGDKVVMWYVSGNRDEEVFSQADKFIIDRENARRHVSFGFGVHRCIGNRLAELQLKIVWEEILKRKLDIAVVGEPTRVLSSFVRGYETLPVRMNA